MKCTKFIKGLKGALACSVVLTMANIQASDTALPQAPVVNPEIEQNIEDFENALVLVKRIENNNQELQEDPITQDPAPTPSQYHYTSEETEQDRLIAGMAERLNNVAGLSNQDGSVIISGRCLSHQDKLILKNFVEGIREQLEKITGLKFPSSAYRILVMGAVPKSRKEDTKTAQYKISIVPDAMTFQGAATIRLIIHHPSAMDSYEFAENVIRGYFALFTYVLRESNYTGPSNEPPGWFYRGLAKQIDFTSRQKDTNDTIHMWSNGYLPTLETLTVYDAAVTKSNDALASSLLGFWLDCGKPKNRLITLFTKLANGQEWSPELFRETIRPKITSNDLDGLFDSWLLAQRFKVLDVGTSTEDLAKRIITHLMFTPGYGIVPETAGVKWVAQHPVELSKFKDEPWAKKFAEKSQRFILIASAGRNDAFRAAAAELSAFYQAVIEGDLTEAELREKYMTAEKKLFAAISTGGN